MKSRPDSSSLPRGTGYNLVMSERVEKLGGSGCAIGPGLVVLFLPVLYVLSYGPAMWLWFHGYLSSQILDAVYAPLGLFRASEWSASSLQWYAGLWQF